jgi:hypothetical protein
MNGRDMLALWKAEALCDARKRAKRVRQALDVMKDKGTPYAIAIRTLAEIHETALAVYEATCQPVVIDAEWNPESDRAVDPA